MSLLPYILSEFNNLSMSTAMDDSPRRSPFSVDDVADLFGDLVQYRQPSRPTLLQLLDGQHRPVVLLPRHLRRQLSSPLPLRHSAKTKKGVSAMGAKDKTKDKGGFAIDVDVQQFRPEELSVQVLKDEGFVVVEGSHEERADEHGFVRRQFTRRYKLPDGVDPDTVTSRLSSDGVLQVTAPRKEALPALQDKVRHVAIALAPSDQPAAPDQPAADKDAKEAKSKEATDDEKVEQ